MSVTITVKTVRREDVTLELGQVTETVTVQAGALTLQTEKTDVHASSTVGPQVTISGNAGAITY